MFHPITAHNPYILGAVLCVVAYLTEHLAVGQWKMVAVLALITFNSMVMLYSPS